MRINGDFIEDLERLQEHYQAEFSHYCRVSSYDNPIKARTRELYEKKRKNYHKCVIGMKWLLELVNEHQKEYWELRREAENEMWNI